MRADFKGAVCGVLGRDLAGYRRPGAGGGEFVFSGRKRNSGPL